DGRQDRRPSLSRISHRHGRIAGRAEDHGPGRERLHHSHPPEDRIDRIAEALSDQLSEIVVGDPSKDGVRMGPLATAAQLRDVRAGIQRLAEESDALFGGTGDVAPAGVADGKGAAIVGRVVRGAGRRKVAGEGVPHDGHHPVGVDRKHALVTGLEGDRRVDNVSQRVTHGGREGLRFAQGVERHGRRDECDGGRHLLYRTGTFATRIGEDRRNWQDNSAKRC
ncbi:MAG: aldehyde dehydrogenase family protein, partial [Gemmatimonadetes bacterium]|nr:aldehyde dehydrogenase family protein [Gemmatimonadota bacterium]